MYILDPLTDDRWEELALHHPAGSAFHQRGWLQALARTYRYRPLALTSAQPGHTLKDAIVFCEVSSWLTGTRLVSLPFADHCDPLLHQSSNLEEFESWLRDGCDRKQWSYIELRPLTRQETAPSGWQAGQSYYFHRLDLDGSLESLFQNLHKDSIQRKVRRAEKEKLSCEVGDSSRLLDEFYHLVLMTRRRHQLLPQPRSWFANLMTCMGEKLRIRVARKDETPIAAMLTLHHGPSVIYKYGCSDERFHSLGGMPFLFWKLIEESKASGAEKIDFGRSDLDNPGLIAFKDKFGTKKSLLTYYRYPRTEKTEFGMNWGMEAARQFLGLLPNAICSRAGGLLYRHMG